MRIFYFLAITLFCSPVIAADFQLPDFVLGTKKTDMKAESLAKTSMTLFAAEAVIETEWADDKLKALSLHFYQGVDYKELRQSFSQLQQQLITAFGALVWVSAETTADSTQTPEQQLALLDQLMATAVQTTAGYRQSHLANSTLVMDFQPAPQPDNNRLHLQVSFSSLTDEYRLILFIDDKTAPERTAPAVINLEAF